MILVPMNFGFSHFFFLGFDPNIFKNFGFIPVSTISLSLLTDDLNMFLIPIIINCFCFRPYNFF